MIGILALLGVGAALLYAGAEVALRGASSFARAAGIPAFTLGALLFGIDPESAGAVLVATGQGQTQLAVGEALGTVLFLFTAAFGVALLVSKRPVPSPPDVMVIAPSIAVAAGALALADRYVSRAEGAILLVVYASYVLLVLWDAGLGLGEEEREEDERSVAALMRSEEAKERPERGTAGRGVSLGLTVAGLGLLYVGASMMVEGGVGLIERTGLTAGFVGATVLGALASLDEVLLEVIPIRRGEPGLATGNLFGTMAAFTSGVLGLAAVIRPLEIDAAGGIAYLAAALLYGLVSLTFLLRGRAGKVLGLVVLASYAAWLLLTAAV